MKTYIVTEAQIEQLREMMDCNSDGDWWYSAKLDEWEKTLVEIKNLPDNVKLSKDDK